MVRLVARDASSVLPMMESCAVTKRGGAAGSAQNVSAVSCAEYPQKRIPFRKNLWISTHNGGELLILVKSHLCPFNPRFQRLCRFLSLSLSKKRQFLLFPSTF